MAKKKPDKNTERRIISPKGGGNLRPGNPGNSGGKKGRSGRKPLAFKALCTEILQDEKTQKALKAAARAPRLPGYGGVIKMLASYSEGLPVQPVSVSGSLTLEQIIAGSRGR